MDGGRLGHAEPLPGRLADEQAEILTEEGQGLPVFGSGKVDLAEPGGRHYLQAVISDFAGNRERTLSPLDRLVLVAGQTEVVGQICRHPPKPALIGEGRRERLCFIETFADGPELAERLQRVTEFEPEIDRLLAQLATLGQVLDGGQGLVEPDHGFPVGRARECLRSRLPQVAGRPIPELGVPGVTSEPLNVLAQPLGIEALEGFHDPGMEPALLLPQQRVIGYPTRQPVLEDVVGFLEEADVIKELGGPEASQGVAELGLRHLGDGLEQGDGHILSDDRRGLEQGLVTRREAVDPRRQDRLDGGRHPERLGRLRQAIVPPLPDEDTVLDLHPDALLEEKRVPPRLLDEQLFEGRDLVVVAEHHAEKLLGFLGKQRMDAELRVVTLTAPLVLVFRTVVDEEKNPRGGELLDQAVEERLGLGVDPVQILEDHAQRLDLTLPQQEAPDRVHGLFPPLERIQ